MPLVRYARGLWAKFTGTENPFSGTSPSMENNLRLIDDHLGLYTLQPPQAPGTPKPDSPIPGDGQIYTDGTYAVFNDGSWTTYQPRLGVRAVLATGTESWLCTGAGWGQFSVVDTGPAITNAVQALQPSVNAAIAAQTRAEAARDSINTIGRVYDSAAAGVAVGTGVASGQTFIVLDASLMFWVTYKNNDGVAVPVARNYTQKYVDAVVDTTYGDTTDWLLAIVDSLNRHLAAWRADGTLVAKLPIALGVANGLSLVRGTDGTYTLGLGTTQGDLPVGTSLLRGGYDNDDGLLCITDSIGRKLLVIGNDGTISGKFTSTEVVAARGNRTDLTMRLSQGLTPYGDPINYVANAWALRETRMRIEKLANGESVQLVVLIIGDSYTQNASRYIGRLAKRLQTAYGFAGVGWIGFCWFGTAAGTWTSGSQPGGLDGSVRTDLVTTLQIIGTWTCTYGSSSLNTPSLSQIVSSTANDYVRFTVPAGHNTCRMFYAGDGTGVVQVSWDDGVTWSANVSLNTTGAANVLLTGVPSGAATARIRVVSGNVALAGVDLSHSTAAGVRVHKLGGSGSSASQWSSVTAAIWAAQIQQLGAHIHQVMFGTNDQSASVIPGSFASQLGTICANIASVLPATDKLVAMPPENQRTTNAFPMTQYAQAAREYAVSRDCAFIDLQYVFGSPNSYAAAYAWGSSRPWYSIDQVHPDPPTGGAAIASALWRLFTTL